MRSVESFYLRALKRCYSDPCLDVIKVPVTDILLPLIGDEKHDHGGIFCHAQEVKRHPRDNAETQTELSAKKLRGYGAKIHDGRPVTSSQFARFLVDRRLLANRSDGADSDGESGLRRKLSYRMSERYISMVDGPVPILQNPRQTLKNDRRDGRYSLQYITESIVYDIDRPEPVGIPSDLDPMMQEAFGFEKDIDPDRITPTYRRELTDSEQMLVQNVATDAAAVTSKAHFHYLEEDNQKEKRKRGSRSPNTPSPDLGSPPLDGKEGGHHGHHHHHRHGHSQGQQTPTEEQVRRAQRHYDEYMAERLERKGSYFEAMHIRSLQEVPVVEAADDFNYTMEREVLEQIMRGVCDHCGEELKHLDLTEIFRYKLLHRDEEFKFDEERFCCAEFQQQIEAMLFGNRRVANVVKDFRMSKVMERKNEDLFDDNPDGVIDDNAAASELNQITKMLKEEDGSDSSEEEEEYYDLPKDAAQELRSMKKKFSDKRAKSGRSKHSKKEKEPPPPPAPVIEDRGSLSDSLKSPQTPKAVVEEVDTRYRGNTMSWALSSRCCWKFGWTLPRPLPSKTSPRLTEKILDGNAPFVAAMSALRWPLLASCAVHQPDDPMVEPYKTLPETNNFFPYYDGRAAVVTAEYAAGRYIVVVLSDSTSWKDSRPAACPITAVFDTAAFGAVVRSDADWTPRVLMTPRDLQIFGRSTVHPDAIVKWEEYAEGVTTPAKKTTLSINSEIKLVVRGRRQIHLGLQNKALTVNVNCGFRSRKSAYRNYSKDQLGNYMKALDQYSETISKSSGNLLDTISSAAAIVSEHHDDFMAYFETASASPHKESPTSGSKNAKPNPA